MNKPCLQSQSCRAAPGLYQRGFSLLEAIVAMVIMATTLLALYAWLGGSTIGVKRANAVILGLEDARIALAVIEGVNPLKNESGSREMGDLTVQWTSTPLAERRAGTTSTGSLAPYDYALYEMEVTTLRAGQATHSFKVRKAGWLATQVMSLEDL